MPFRKNFIWGTATSSYQIEGGGLDYGRGECIWHRFSHTDGKVYNNENGDIACDHIHRYKEDVQLMKNLGVDAYRFSISWPRILPNGTGAINQQGVDFYNRLIDELLANDIAPYITLYHWDLPQALQDRGEGWENPDSVHWFTDYARIVSEFYGDRVKNWTTFNEPWAFSFVGNLQGRHAPGKQHYPTAVKVAHHALLAHGSAVPVIRETVKDASVGITLDLTVADPLSNSEQDQQAARRHEAHKNSWFLDPVFKGEYPADFAEYLHSKNLIPDGIDLTAISSACVPIDFLGVNYYTRGIVTYDPDDIIEVKTVRNPDAEYTAMNWEVYPEGIERLMLHLHTDYHPKAIYITENGCAFEDPVPNADGIVEDPRRVNYYQVHLDALERAAEQGVPMVGYFAWSFMDNFEWGYGYAKRFGIHYTDYDTLERYPKQTALYYQERIKEHKALTQ